MTELRTLLLASNNRHKWTELTAMLSGLPYQVVTLDDLGVRATIEETGETFDDNARLKAETFAGLSGVLSLADDSGIVVDALNGDPGVRSARYGGDGLDDAGRTQLLLANTAHLPDGERAARFVCVIAIAEPGKPAQSFHGVVEGSLAHEVSGPNGFGYDPIFIPIGWNRTFGQATSEEKHALSHRGMAMEFAKIYLAELTNG